LPRGKVITPANSIRTLQVLVTVLFHYNPIQRPKTHVYTASHKKNGADGYLDDNRFPFSHQPLPNPITGLVHRALTLNATRTPKHTTYAEAYAYTATGAAFI